jgi:hypothetical protein
MVQVGAGPHSQILRLFPSTTLPEMYFIHPDGCPKGANDSMAFNGQTCRVSRDGLFNNSASLSYVPKSIYDLSAYATFRQSGFNQSGFNKIPGQVGWDSVELNYPKEGSSHSDNGRVDHLTVVEITNRNYT